MLYIYMCVYAVSPSKRFDLFVRICVAVFLCHTPHRWLFLAPPTQDTGGWLWISIYWKWRDVKSRADGTCCQDSGSLLSVCGDSWFILGAMIAHAPQVCSPTQPRVSSVWLRPGGAANKLSTTHTPQYVFCLCLYFQCFLCIWILWCLQESWIVLNPNCFWLPFLSAMH